MQTHACNTSVFLNSGYLAENNRENNTVRVTAKLDENDPLLAVKLDLINEKDSDQDFIIKANFCIKDTYQFISWLRFAAFDEDEAYLALHRTQCLKTA